MREGRPFHNIYPDPPVRHDAIFGVMGAGVRFQTNSARLFTLAVETFARFGPPTRETPFLHMRLFAHPVTPLHPDDLWPLVTRGDDRYYYVTWGPGSTLVADLERGYLFGYIAPDILQWPHLVREHFLLAPVLYTLSRHTYVPLTLAVLLWRRRYPLYLVREEHVDVTPLLYQAVRARWRLVAERVVMAVPTPRGWHFWGVPWWLHLPCESLRAFPELTPSLAALQPDGSWRLVLDVEDAWPGSTEPHAGPGPLVYLRETPDGHVTYDWMDANELLGQAATWIAPDLPWVQEEVYTVITYLADQGTYRFDFTHDWAYAIERLAELAERHWRP